MTLVTPITKTKFPSKHGVTPVEWCIETEKWKELCIVELKRLKQERQIIIKKYPKDTIGKTGSLAQINLIDKLIEELEE